MGLDRHHVRRVQRVLDALVGATPRVDVPHAILACEDAGVALRIGLAFGMSVADVAAEHAALLAAPPDVTGWPVLKPGPSA